MEAQSKSKPSNSVGAGASFVFIFFTVLLDSVGFGIILPVMPQLIMSLTGEGLSSASAIGGWLLFSYAIMQFLFSPLIGNLSDRYGRRPVLLISVGVLAIDYLIMGLAPTLFWLFVGRLLSGIAGATFSTAYAYVADVSAPEERAKRYGFVGAAFGFGFILGPVIGGLLGEYGPRVPFYAAAALGALNFIYGFFFVKESLPLADRRAFDWRRANPMGALLNLRKYPMLVGLSVAYVLYLVAHYVLPSTWSYFVMEKFAWSERDIGYSLGFVGVLMVIVQGGLIAPANKWLGERWLGVVGFVAIISGFMAFALVTSDFYLYVWLVPFALSGFVTPAFQGIMTNQVPANSQGELQGALTSLNSVTAIVGPLVMTQTFSFFTAKEGALVAPVYFPGAAFVLAGGLCLLSLLVFVWATRGLAVNSASAERSV